MHANMQTEKLSCTQTHKDSHPSCSNEPLTQHQRPAISKWVTSPQPHYQTVI